MWNQEQARHHRESLGQKLGKSILPARPEVLLYRNFRLWIDTHSVGFADSRSSLHPIQFRGLIATVATSPDAKLDGSSKFLPCSLIQAPRFRLTTAQARERQPYIPIEMELEND